MDGFGPVTVTAAEVTPAGKPNSYNCHLDAEVIVEAKMVATSRNVTLAEYVTELVRDLVHRDLEQETAPASPRAQAKAK
ncbi:MAG: hypothetical protein ACLQU5_26855 [Isosphaeraceae bacterium]